MQQRNNIKVLVVGGARDACDFIEILKNAEGIDLVGVCDVEKNSEGIRYASGLGVETSTNLVQFVNDKEPDILIETSGSKEYQKILFQITGKNVKVVDASAARILLEVAKQKEEHKRYDDLHLVNDLAAIFSADLDSHNIVVKLFDTLKPIIGIDLIGVLIYGSPKHEFVLASEYGL